MIIVLYKHLSKCITCKIFSKFSREGLAILRSFNKLDKDSHVIRTVYGEKYINSKRADTVIIFLYQNGNVWKYFKTKSDQNMHKNSSNCFIFLNFLMGT